MNTETLSWSGQTTIELHGTSYDCSLECDVQISKWTERHEPFYSEPMSEAMVCLTDFEVMDSACHAVLNQQLRRDIKAALITWVEENEDTIIKGAK